MAKPIILLLFISVSIQALNASDRERTTIEISLINQVRQSLDDVYLDYLIPNGLGVNYTRKDWSGSLSYAHNAYFIQNPSLNISVFKDTRSHFGTIGFSTAINRVKGIEHYFQKNVYNRYRSDIYHRQFLYTMTEFGLFGHDISLHPKLQLEGSIRIGIINELKGQARPTKYARTPLKFWSEIGHYRVSVSWDYIVHDLMQGWDVDNFIITIGYQI